MDTMPVRAVQGRISNGRYDFNLLVSCGWGEYAEAKREIARLLVDLGDKQPEVRKTLARGITGVRTSLDPRSVIIALRNLPKRPLSHSAHVEMDSHRSLDRFQHRIN